MENTHTAYAKKICTSFPPYGPSPIKFFKHDKTAAATIGLPQPFFCVPRLIRCPTDNRFSLCRSSDLRLWRILLRPYPAFSGFPNDWLSPTDTASAHTAAVTVRDSHPVPLFTFRASMSWCRQRKPQRFLFNSVCIVAPGSQNVKSAVAHPAPIHRPASLFIPGVICYNPLRKPLPFNSGRSGHGLPTSSGGAGGP